MLVALHKAEVDAVYVAFAGGSHDRPAFLRESGPWTLTFLAMQLHPEPLLRMIDVYPQPASPTTGGCLIGVPAVVSLCRSAWTRRDGSWPSPLAPSSTPCHAA
jgi:hypothetical protein